ncbi:hypothetical protein [Aurantibacter aestuarii]|uniref:Uncharacterized protein n=1 Tax=Aurantibacter aestuarii TaxID=1266046 RepID=A0A2T1NES7_9FLAO|nr:hypothetical protein [Aurantibacter aestuarii]PSG90886.1 hypothetical protein C7H52_06325 [Aurantibacter aestuarii]
MSNFVDKFKSGSIQALKDYAWIPLLLLGFLLYAVGAFLEALKNWEIISSAFHSIGTTIVTATVFVTIVKSKQFSDIFNEQLRSIIYCTEYMKNRKDIKNLWITTSKSMYKENFPDLCDKIEENLEKYIPMDSNKYYEDYTYKVDIEFDKNNPDFIILNERETFILHAHTIEKTDYISSCIFNKSDYNEDVSDYSMVSFRVNGKDLQITNKYLQIDKNYKGNKILVQHKRTLSGDKKYKIEKIERKKYSLNVENTKAHSCMHIFKNYNLEVSHPADLEVKFYENGTLNNFTKLPERSFNGTGKIQRFEYEGLMFKNQGTRIIFRDLRK